MKTFLIRNPVFIFCFCYGIIISSTCYGQVNFSIQGNIKSQNTESFISDAAVTLYRISESGTRIPIAFTFTDIVGNFLLMVEIPKANLLLTISHIGYISIEKKITIDENIRSKNFNLLMQKNAVALDSIQIKDLPIKIKKDTIEYLASSFSNENTRKIGDLLKNIDGFVVQKDGRINYKGKEVSALLINGDDLASGQYGMLTQNLNSAFIEKVQVFENYNKNRIAGELIPSGEVAVNLKSDKKFEGKFNGSVSAGTSFMDKNIIEGNMLLIKNKVKFVQLLGWNTIGKKIIDNNSESEDRNFFPSAFSSEQIIHASTIPAPNLEENYISKNNDGLFASFLNYNFNNKLKMSVKVNYLSGTERFNSESNNTTYLSEQNKWQISSIQQLKNKLLSFTASINIMHDNLKKFSGDLILDYSKASNHSYFNSLFSGAITDTLLENLNLRQNILKLKYYGVTKINTYTILNFKSTSLYQPSIYDFDVTTSMYSAYFNLPNENILYSQILNTIRLGNKTAIAIISKKRNTSFRLGIGVELLNEYPKNKLLALSLSSQQKSSLISTKRLKNISEKYGPEFILIKPLAAKMTLTFQGTTGMQHSSIMGISQKGRIIYNTQALVSYKFKAFSQISFSITSAKEFPPFNYFYLDSLLAGSGIIQEKSKELALIEYHQASIESSLFNIRKNASFTSNFWIKKYEINYRANFFLTPEYSTLTYSPVSNDKEYGIIISGKTFVFPLQSSISLTTFWQKNNGNRRLNGSIVEDKSQNINSTFSLITNFKIPANAEFLFSYGYSENKVRNNDYIFKNNFSRYNFQTKISWRINSKAFVGGIYNFLNNNSEGNFNACDFFSSYIISRKIKFDFKVFNILNNTLYNEKYISPNAINLYSFHTIGRYMLVMINFSF